MPAAHPLIRKPIVEQLFRYLESSGIDATPYRDACCWQVPEIEGLEPAIEVSAFFDLLDRVAADTGNENLGLHYYQHSHWEDFGHLGFAARHSTDVRGALQLYCRYTALLQEGTHCALARPEGLWRLEYRVLPPLAPNRYDNDLANLGMISGIRLLLQDPGWLPDKVGFMHAEPADTSEYRKLLYPCDVVFGSDSNYLSLSQQVLDTPVVGSDRRLYQLMRADVERILAPEVTLAEEVMKVLLQTLPDHLPGLVQLAATLEISPRSLQRRLAEEGYTYKHLCDEVREKRARELLQDQTTPLAEIALLLDYAELSPFIRAFRRWVGVTPQEYRKQLK